MYHYRKRLRFAKEAGVIDLNQAEQNFGDYGRSSMDRMDLLKGGAKKGGEYLGGGVFAVEQNVKDLEKQSAKDLEKQGVFVFPRP